jgi:hypothetical protein
MPREITSSSGIPASRSFPVNRPVRRIGLELLHVVGFAPRPVEPDPVGPACGPRTMPSLNRSRVGRQARANCIEGSPHRTSAMRIVSFRQA